MIRTRLLMALFSVAVIAGGSAAAGGAQQPGPDRTPHLLTVPANAAGQSALDKSSARVIARYGAYTLVEASGDDYAKLRAAGADRRDDMRDVQLGPRTLDPSSQRTPLVTKGRSVRSLRAGLALVQFVGPPKDSWLTRLRATGVQVVQYMPQNAYLVQGNGRELQKAGDLLGTDVAVRAVSPYVSTDKVVKGVKASGSQAVEIQTIAGAPGAAARTDARAAGKELRPPEPMRDLVTQYVVLDAAERDRLARDPGVVAVLPYALPKLLDERAALLVAGFPVSLGGSSPADYLSWVDSKVGSSPFNFAIDITDEGLDNGQTPGAHPDFFENSSSPTTTRIAYQHEFLTSSASEDQDARDCGGHGTNVASIAAGFNNGSSTSGTTAQKDAAGYHYGLGVAPRAKIGGSRIFDCGTGKFDIPGSGSSLSNASDRDLLNSSYRAIASDAYAAGARISNNSWGSDTGGAYDADAQAYDGIVRDSQSSVVGDQGLVEVFAAGNAGDSAGHGAEASTVGSPGTAKNVITVGASENVRAIGGVDGCGVPEAGADNANDVIGFSSRGPTADARQKPDLVAPGTHLTGASPQNPDYDGTGTCNKSFPALNTRYSLLSGTSQATPEVSGAAALSRKWLSDPTQLNAAPSPAMTKAFLVNTATDLEGGSDGADGTLDAAPNGDQGWGRVNLGNAFDSTVRSYADQTHVFTSSGDPAYQQTYDVVDPSKPLKVTLAWTDAPGSTNGGSWENDLDLEVDAGGKTYKGNWMSGGVSIPGGAADPRNNVESVYLPPGLSGSVRVRVIPKTIAGDGVPGNAQATDQDFALVASDATPVSKPVLVGSATSPLVDSGGISNGFAEPGETVTFSQGIKNSGDIAATGVNGTLHGTASSSPYPDIAVGATSTNSTPFSFAVPGGASCGADIQTSVDLTTGQGSFTVPLTIPTGQPQQAATFESTAIPRDIPDGLAKGVTLSLNISDPGIVKDLNVKLDQITHSWDGDLRISLESPSHTTVMLADRPRGPGYDQPNFTNTVFDDQAAQTISAGSAPFTDSFRPQLDQLSRFNGESQQGTWKLHVSDLFPGDVGSIRSWGLQISSAACPVSGDYPPMASFHGDAGPVRPGQMVNFTSDSSDIDGPIADQSWDLNGDGVFGDATGTSASTSFTSHGLHTVRLRVTQNGQSTDASRTVLVNTLPTGVIDVSPSAPVRGETITLDSSGSSDPDGPVTREWDVTGHDSFGDGTGVTNSVVYQSSGPHTVSLRLTDSDGESIVVSKTFTVVNPPAAPTPSPPTPTPTPKDTTRPVVKIGRAASKIASAIKKGVRLKMSCNEACTITSELRLDKRTAKKLHIAASTVRVARTTVKLTTAGSRTVTLKLTRSARKGLARTRRVQLKLSVTAVDGAGNRTVVRRTLSLRR